MIWQDWVIMFVQWGFIVSLIPTIRHPSAKPPLTTCILTIIGLATMAFCFATLRMWASVASLSILAVLWGIIGYQRYGIDTAARECIGFRKPAQLRGA